METDFLIVLYIHMYIQGRKQKRGERFLWSKAFKYCRCITTGSSDFSEPEKGAKENINIFLGQGLTQGPLESMRTFSQNLTDYNKPSSHCYTKCPYIYIKLLQIVFSHSHKSPSKQQEYSEQELLLYVMLWLHG